MSHSNTYNHLKLYRSFCQQNGAFCVVNPKTTLRPGGGGRTDDVLTKTISNGGSYSGEWILRTDQSCHTQGI